MNLSFQRNQYNGFGVTDTLMSRLNFQGIIRCDEKQLRSIHRPNEEIHYWIIKDDFGARMSCFEETLAETLVTGEIYKVQGEVKIGKGGIFLNLKKAEPFYGSAFSEKVN